MEGSKKCPECGSEDVGREHIKDTKYTGRYVEYCRDCEWAWDGDWTQDPRVP